MKIIASISEMQSLAGTLRAQKKIIGFVPTMGFLHEGHLSLMKKAGQECDFAVVSIFVNPTQFGPGEDFDRYPRDVEGDRKKCEAMGIDALFIPAADDMYPKGGGASVSVAGISDILEGAIRPGHFTGVATVVAKLFNIVRPHRAYFGQKDYQQCVVIRRMASGLNMDVDVSVLPTVREADGLAMSSRNTYLDRDERKAAPAVYRALLAGETAIRSGESDLEKLREKIRSVLLGEKAVSIDYVEIADPESVMPLKKAENRMVLLVAARLGRTRLIDNLLIM